MPSWKSIFRGQSRLPSPEHVPDMEEPTTNGSVADRTGNRPGDRPSTGAGMGSPLQKPGLPFDGRTIGVCLLLFAVVFWVFAPATRNGFIDWDDGLFVTENPQVRSGLTWGGLLWVWLVFAIGQGIEGNFITPKLVGSRIGLHPVAVIFALLAFGQVFGFPGLLLALPASAVLLVGLRKLRELYLASSFYNSGR